MAPLTVDLDRPPTREEVTALLPGWLGVALPAALPHFRWFGDKDRAIREVTVADLVADPDRPDWLGWARLLVQFDEGAPTVYGLPLALVAGEDAEALVTVRTPDGIRSVVDGSRDPDFPRWWLGLHARRASLTGQRGSLDFTTLPGFAALAPSLAGENGRVLAAEQSNTNLRYGTRMVAKLFRRLEHGLNPDVEVSTRLWPVAGFRGIPEPLGMAEYRDEELSTVGFAQAFVTNRGDGWEWTLAGLRGNAASLAIVTEAMAQLGERTGALHRALARCGDDDAFAPVRLAAAQCDQLLEASLANLDRTLGALRDARASLPEAARPLVEDVVAGETRLRERLAGFRALEGTFAVRVHGDFHLGQTLRTLADDWVILDFEGEPARPMRERRAKTSVLKDVGGLLRSLAYARGAAASAGDGPSPTRLTAWEAAARVAFVAAYRRRVADPDGPPLVPSDDPGFDRALDAWVLDKALYEVRYELANRPDWVTLPLAALVSGD